MPNFWKRCEPGSAAGQCKFPGGVATDTQSGHVYVADRQNERVDEFTAWGEFVKAWGWGVRDGSPEPQVCTALTGCRSAAGRLGIDLGQGRTIGAGGAGEFNVPQNVAVDSAGDVYVADRNNHRIQKFSSAGEFLRTWGGGVVSGGAAGTGDVSAGSTQVSNLVATSKAFEIGQTVTGVGILAGTQVIGLGVGTMTLSQPATTTTAGTTITAAEGAGNVPTNERQTITVGGPPTGGSFTLTFNAGELAGVVSSGANQVTGTHVITELTVGAYHIGDRVSAGAIPPATTITAIDTTTGNLTLSAPASASSSNERIVASETTGSIPYNANAAEVQAALEALPAIGTGNAAVTGPAGGPWTVEFEGPLLGDVNLSPRTSSPLSASASGLTPSGAVSVVTLRQGASAAEVCSVAADCRSGIEGGEAGQFEEWPTSSFIAVGPADQIYVGDKNRIQHFNTAGVYQSQVPLPEPGQVGSLAADPLTGDLYFSYTSPPAIPFNSIKHNVFRIDSTTGNLLDVLEVGIPTAVATGQDGSVYVVDHAAPGNSFEPGNHITRILKFSPSGDLIEVVAQNEESSENGSQKGPGNEFEESTGIATGSACLGSGEDLYVANTTENAFVRAYGPPPDNTELCPQPKVPPDIDAQYAITVGASDATLGADINPRFWPDATYFVQYGTGKCSEGGCLTERPYPPGADLGGGIVEEDIATAGIFLTGLAPDTTYHYRFVATSGGGGPVTGAERTFTTYPDTEDLGLCPANEAFRSGPSRRCPTAAPTRWSLRSIKKGETSRRSAVSTRAPIPARPSPSPPFGHSPVLWVLPFRVNTLLAAILALAG